MSHEKSPPRYAGFWQRAIADLFDSMFLDVSAAIVVLMFLGIFYWIGVFQAGSNPSSGGTSWMGGFDPVQLQYSVVGMRLVLSLLYFTWATFRWGTTLGKRYFRIFVVNASDESPVTLKQSLIRCLGYAVSYFPLGAGFFMVIFNPKKQALHDLVAGTVSVKR